MNEAPTRTALTYRRFIEAVRGELATAGRQDVIIERTWIDEDEPGYPFLLHVPVGTELTVPLQPKCDFLEVGSKEDLVWHASEFAKALVNLKHAETMLLKYARGVRTTANEVIASARADGLDVLLDRVGFKPTYASHLTGKDWKDAAYHVLAAVTVRHTSFYLRPDTSTHWVEEPADIAAELQSLLEEQRQRQDRIAELDAVGADLIVDGITLDILAAHGLDVEDTLRSAWKKQCLNLKVEFEGHERALSLVTYDGRVTASFDLPEGYWNGEHLWFDGDERDVDHQGLVGKSLGSLVSHPAFTSRTIASIHVRHIDHFSFDLSRKYLFDADSGRVWPQEPEMSLAA